MAFCSDNSGKYLINLVALIGSPSTIITSCLREKVVVASGSKDCSLCYRAYYFIYSSVIPSIFSLLHQDYQLVIHTARNKQTLPFKYSFILLASQLYVEKINFY
jgi:hypothetical protein